MSTDLHPNNGVYHITVGAISLRYNLMSTDLHPNNGVDHITSYHDHLIQTSILAILTWKFMVWKKYCLMHQI